MKAEIERLLEAALTETRAMREAVEWAAAADGPLAPHEIEEALLWVESLPLPLIKGADPREATAREALGGHLLRALWRSDSPDMLSLAAHSPGGIVAGRFVFGDDSRKRSSFLHLSIEQAFEQATPDEAIAGFKVCQHNLKTQKASSAKELAWFGATIAASKFPTAKAAAERFLDTAPKVMGMFEFNWAGAGRRLHETLLRAALPPDTMASRAQFVEALVNQCLANEYFIDDLKAATFRPHTTLIENVNSWRHAADQWCVASPHSKAWEPLSHVANQLEANYAHCLSETGKRNEAEQWLRKSEFYSFKRALQEGDAAIPYLKTRLKERTAILGEFRIADFFFAQPAPEDKEACLLSGASSPVAIAFFLQAVGIEPAAVKSESGQSPLFFVEPSARIDSVRVFDALRQAGFKPDETDVLGQTPFHILATKLAGSARAVPFFSALLAIGGKPEIKDNEGRDALAAAREHQSQWLQNFSPSASNIAHAERRALRDKNLAFLEQCVLEKVIAKAKKTGEEACSKTAQPSSAPRQPQRI